MAETAIPHQDITYRIIGAAMKVHRRTPRGLKEQHYQRALTAEMIADGLIVSEDHHIEIYKVGLLLNLGASRLEYRRILPPKSMQGWQVHIAKYLWRPPDVNK
jgi:hypothetical protein